MNTFRVYTWVYSQLGARTLNEMRGWCACVCTGAEGVAGCAAGRTPAATGIGGRAVCPCQAPAASHHVSTLSAKFVASMTSVLCRAMGYPRNQALWVDFAPHYTRE